MPLKVSVVQVGARNHYLTPATLAKLGMLGALYTDVYLTERVAQSSLLTPLAHFSPNLAAALRNRRGAMLDDSVVYSWQLAWRGLSRRFARRSERGVALLDASLADRVARLAVKDGFRGSEAVYAYSSGAPYLFREALRQNVKTVLDQASATVEVASDLVDQEAKLWPGWSQGVDVGAWEIYRDRQKAELELADLILAPSKFVVRSLEAVGVESSRIKLVPYGVPVNVRAQNRFFTADRPLRVLYVGNVSLQKGVPYLLEAAKRLRKNLVNLRIVGASYVDEGCLRPYSNHVEFVGRVSRDQVSEHYAWADVLCLPSLSDGFGMVQVEALAHGLPVIATTNSGDVVCNEEEGLVVEPASVTALKTAMEKLVEDRSLLRKMSEKTCHRLEYFSLESYGIRLVEALSQFGS